MQFLTVPLGRGFLFAKLKKNILELLLRIQSDYHQNLQDVSLNQYHKSDQNRKKMIKKLYESLISGTYNASIIAVS